MPSASRVLSCPCIQNDESNAMRSNSQLLYLKRLFQSHDTQHASAVYYSYFLVLLLSFKGEKRIVIVVVGRNTFFDVVVVVVVHSR